MRTQWDNGIYTIQVVKHGWETHRTFNGGLFGTFLGDV